MWELMLQDSRWWHLNLSFLMFLSRVLLVSLHHSLVCSSKFTCLTSLCVYSEAAWGAAHWCLHVVLFGTHPLYSSHIPPAPPTDIQPCFSSPPRGHYAGSYSSARTGSTASACSSYLSTRNHHRLELLRFASVKTEQLNATDENIVVLQL